MANTKILSEQIADDVALGGSPTTTTQSASDNSTKVATTAYVTTAVANLVDSAPSSLNTLNELAAAMNDNASFFSTVLPLSGGTMTGALIGTTATFTTADNASQLTLTSTDADSSIGPRMDFFRNSASPANDDNLAQLRFLGRNNNSETVTYAAVAVTGHDVGDGTEDGKYKINIMVNGSSTTLFKLTSSEIVLNESSKDIDFRVESDGNANMLFVDAGNDRVGIGTNSPSGLMNVHSASGDANVFITTGTTNAGTTLFFGDSDSSSVGRVQYDHNDNSMRFQTNASEAVRILADGKVGIGTSSPAQPLHVDATGGTTAALFDNNGTNGDVVRVAKNGTDVLKIRAEGTADLALDANGGAFIFKAGGTERSRITSAGILQLAGGGNDSVGEINFGNTAQDANRLQIRHQSSSWIIKTVDSEPLLFGTANSERARILANGTFLIGKTADDNSVGFKSNTSSTYMVADGQTPAFINRLSDDGDILEFRNDSSAVGKIGNNGTALFIASPHGNDSGVKFGDRKIVPCTTSGVGRDDAIDLGSSSSRFDTVFAKAGSINTSDRNEKQDIEELSDAEKRVAVAAKGLLRKYRWKSAVAEKGDDARIHFGIIAQDLQDAFSAEGLDAARYGMWCSDTFWIDSEGEPYDKQEEAPEGATEQTQLGVRYSELLAFIIAAI